MAEERSGLNLSPDLVNLAQVYISHMTVADDIRNSSKYEFPDALLRPAFTEAQIQAAAIGLANEQRADAMHAFWEAYPDTDGDQCRR